MINNFSAVSIGYDPHGNGHSIIEKTYIVRDCYFQGENASMHQCLEEKTPLNVTLDYCETCLTEGCNSASHIALLVTIIPTIIAKVLLF